MLQIVLLERCAEDCAKKSPFLGGLVLPTGLHTVTRVLVEQQQLRIRTQAGFKHIGKKLTCTTGVLVCSSGSASTT